MEVAPNNNSYVSDSKMELDQKSSADVVAPSTSTTNNLESERKLEQNKEQQAKIDNANSHLGESWTGLKSTMADSGSKLQENLHSVLNNLGDSIIEYKNLGVQKAGDLKDRIVNAVYPEISEDEMKGLKGISTNTEQQQAQAHPTVGERFNEVKGKVYEKMGQAGESLNSGLHVAGEKLSDFKNYSVEKASELKTVAVETASDLSARAKAQFASTAAPTTEPVVASSSQAIEQKPTTEEHIGNVREKISEFEHKIHDQEELKHADESNLGKRKFQITDEPEYLLSAKQNRTD